MKTWYHTAKRQGLELPKILGLSASIVVKSVKREEFQKEKTRLEKVLDATVETCEGISSFETNVKRNLQLGDQIELAPPALRRDLQL